jgi:16S rRNA (adenine(1408)-N(1))-methyltransferase
VDLGTGDGRFVLAHAAAHPDRFVLGIDAHHAAMVDASRRAARPAGRGGVANARFVVSSLEALPVELHGVADLVTVHFPWASLRAAAAGHEPMLTARLARLVRPDGRLDMLLADADRDRAQPVDSEAVVAAYAGLGMSLVEARPASVADAIAAHSSWGKRLLRNGRPGRSAWIIRLERPRSV